MARPKNVEREPMREPARPTNAPAGRVVAYNSKGEPVWRRQTEAHDRFHIPDELKQKGWSYEWKAYTIFGQPQRQTLAQYEANGWEMVTHSAFPGVYASASMSQDDPIIVGDLVLMMRADVLTAEARQDEKRRADQAVQSRLSQHGLADKLSGLNGRVQEVRGKDGTFIHQERGAIEVDRAEYDLG